MFTRSIRQVGLALAAVALSATVAMPFAQPAHAVGEPRPVDLVVKYVDGKYVGPPAEPPMLSHPDSRTEVYFALFNQGGTSSGAIFVEKWCRYSGGHGGSFWANMTQMPLPMEPSLKPDDSRMITVSCPRRNGGTGGVADGARVKVRTTNEPANRLGNNQDEETWFGVG